MMGKKALTLVVPHYKEPWETGKPLFDSIALQHGIDFDDFKVMIVNDGDEVVLDKALFEPYRFEVEYVIKPWGGLSDTRNYGIENCGTDYLMYCDFDDMFLSNYGLHLALGAIQEGFDICIGSFVEEQPVDGGWRIFRRDKSHVFCHAKIYRAQFLLDKNLRFDTGLWFSEDSVFNNLAIHEAERDGKVKYIETPFYLWAWNAGSTVRKDRETMVLRNYDQVMGMRTKTIEGLKERGFDEDYKGAICRAMADAYCDFNQPVFTKACHEKLVEKAEREFKKFYKKYISVFMSCDSEQIGKALMEARVLAYDSGLRVEKIDYKGWLKHIRNDVKL